MESVKEKAINLGVVLIVGLLSFFTLSIFFSPLLRSKKETLEEKRKLLQSAEALLSRKEALEKEWQEKKALLPSASSPDEALNLWVKELLGQATSQNLTFTKMEPQGLKEKDGRKEIRLFLAFEGDIRKLLYLLYYLLEKDPLSRIESFSIKEGEARTFSYELTLGKILL
jgi:hypothetical protein